MAHRYSLSRPRRIDLLVHASVSRVSSSFIPVYARRRAPQIQPPRPHLKNPSYTPGYLPLPHAAAHLPPHFALERSPGDVLYHTHTAKLHFAKTPYPGSCTTPSGRHHHRHLHMTMLPGSYRRLRRQPARPPPTTRMGKLQEEPTPPRLQVLVWRSINRNRPMYKLFCTLPSHRLTTSGRAT